MADFTEENKTDIWAAAHTAQAVEVRIFGRPPAFLHPGVSGIDALITSPRVTAEFFRRRAMGTGSSIADYAAASAHETYIESLTRGELADIVWRQLFIDHPPLSEACRVVLTTLGMFGLDVSQGDLRLLREQYDRIPAPERLERILALANLDLILYPVESMAVDAHLDSPPPPPAFRPVLSLAALMHDWKEGARRLRLQGFGLKARVDEFTPLELRRHLSAEIEKLNPAAISLDWPAGHRPDDNCIGRLVREAVVPLCRDNGLAFMIAAGDEAIDTLAPLWEQNPGNRFLLFPGRGDQLAAAVMAAAGNRNLLLSGPDQPLSGPLDLEPFVSRRLEALGSAFHACHSCADTAEELVGCWAHMRWNFGKALIRHYADLWRTGWRFLPADITKDTAAMLGGNVRAFLGL